MPLRLSTRFAVAAVAVLGSLVSAGAVGAAVTWVRFEDPTCVDDGGTRSSDFVLRCGSFGSFLFDNSEGRSGEFAGDDFQDLLARSTDRAGDQCAPEANGSEIPPTVTDQPVPAGVAWEPCTEGSCFSDPLQAPDDDWIAVIDWQTLHGRSVAHTIAQTSPSAVGLKLFDLAEPGVREIATLERVGDAHILAQLCGVAQDSLEHPPMAINMSFGRMHAADQSECTPQDGELRCQIEALVDHLQDDYGVQAFAAAGNHGELTFPASVPGVLSVGSLELGLFWPGGTSVAAHNSPAEVDLLFPGYGLVLEGVHSGQVWPVPPGSSYASAVATGWLSGYALSHQSPDAQMATLAQAARASELSLEILGTELALRIGGSVLPGSVSLGATRLTHVALGFVPGRFRRCRSPDRIGLEQ